MKCVLFILLTITVHNTFQNKKVQELKLKNSEKRPEAHEKESNNLRKADIKDLTNIKDSDTQDLQPYSKYNVNNHRELRDGGNSWTKRWISMYKIINWVNNLFKKRPKDNPRSKPTRHPKIYTTTRKLRHKEKRKEPIYSLDMDDTLPYWSDDKDDSEEQIFRHLSEYKNIDLPMIYVAPARK